MFLSIRLCVTIFFFATCTLRSKEVYTFVSKVFVCCFCMSVFVAACICQDFLCLLNMGQVMSLNIMVSTFKQKLVVVVVVVVWCFFFRINTFFLVVVGFQISRFASVENILYIVEFLHHDRYHTYDRQNTKSRYRIRRSRILGC